MGMFTQSDSGSSSIGGSSRICMGRPSATTVVTVAKDLVWYFSSSVAFVGAV